MNQADQVRAWCAERIGNPYIYGGTGKICTVAYREARAAQYPTYAAKIQKNCQRMNGKSTKCEGCKWYDEKAKQGKRAYDCAQLVRWCMDSIGITMVSGANSQWEKTNWLQKGTIDSIPMNKICLVYRKDSNGKMGHTGIYTGDGFIVHAKGHDYGVVREMLGVPTFTHWGIPYGLDTEVEPMEITWPMLRVGAANDYVTVMQGMLNLSGLANLKIDGKFGAKTEISLKNFQSAHKLTADGVCGPKTWAALMGVKENEITPTTPAAPVTPVEPGELDKTAIVEAIAVLEADVQTLKDLTV